MIGRSFLSLLAVVTVVVQSSFTSELENTYRLELFPGKFMTALRIDRPVALMDENDSNDRSQDWTVARNENGTCVIRNVHSKLFLAPASPDEVRSSEFVLQSSEPYHWSLDPSEGRHGQAYRIRTGDGSLVVGVSRFPIYPRPVDTEVQDSKRPQVWKFNPVEDLHQKTTCG